MYKGCGNMIKTCEICDEKFDSISKKEYIVIKVVVVQQD